MLFCRPCLKNWCLQFLEEQKEKNKYPSSSSVPQPQQGNKERLIPKAYPPDHHIVFAIMRYLMVIINLLTFAYICSLA